MKVNFLGISDSIWTVLSRSRDSDDDFRKCTWYSKFTDARQYDYQYGVIVTRSQYEDWTISSWSDPLLCEYDILPIHPLSETGTSMSGDDTSHMLFLFDDADVASMFKLTWQ